MIIGEYAKDEDITLVRRLDCYTPGTRLRLCTLKYLEYGGERRTKEEERNKRDFSNLSVLQTNTDVVLYIVLLVVVSYNLQLLGVDFQF